MLIITIVTIIVVTIISSKNQMVRMTPWVIFVLFWSWFLNQGDQGSSVFTVPSRHFPMVDKPNLKGPKPGHFSRGWCHHPKGSDAILDLSFHPFCQVFLIAQHVASFAFSLKLSEPPVSSAATTSQTWGVICYSAWNTAIPSQPWWGSIFWS